MLHDLAASPAFWGFLGALMYAGPRVIAGVFTRRERGLGPWEPILEFVAAVFVGTVTAEAFTAWALQHFKLEEPHHLRGVGVMLGLLANPAAPRVVDLVAGRLLGRLKGALGE